MLVLQFIVLSIYMSRMQSIDVVLFLFFIFTLVQVDNIDE
jgi:hypothetical protein